MTRLRRRLQILAVLLVTAGMVASGCGLKPEVMDAAGGAEGLTRGGGINGEGGAFVDPETGALTEGGEDATAGSDTGDGAGTDGTGTGSGDGAGATDGRGGGNGATDNGGTGGTSSGTSGPGDRTGVTDKEITIGVHAPVTGAAAFPSASFRKGVGVYADFINSKGGINGRKLRVLFEDDRFDPNAARQKCAKMAEQQKAFLLIGGGGSDQIDACARYAATKGVPYVSGGVHEQRPRVGSIATRTYFALSMSYEQQIPLLVNLIRSDHNGKKVALLVADNDSLDNFYNRADSGVKRAFGNNVVLSRRVPKNTGARDAPEIGRQICSSGAEVAIWNGAPTGLINVSKAMVCTVRWMGPGNTNGLNIVATGGCPQIDKAQYFATIPGIDDADKFDRDFRAAYRRKHGEEPDDIAFLLWGVEKLVAQMLAKSGKDLSREKFMATLANGSFNNGVYPPVSYGGKTRFGGTAMHLLQADCSDRKYKTQRTYVRP